MFCSRCGKEASEASKYCSACGFSLQQSSVAGPSGIDSEAKQPVVKSPMNFQEFLKRKAESRKEHFKFRPKSAKKVEKDVSINIGIMRYVNGTFLFAATFFICSNFFYLQQLFLFAATFFICSNFFLFAATFFICSNFFYLHQFFYLQHLFLICSTFFICSNFFYLQQLFLFAANFLFAATFFICSNFFLFAATSFFICSNLFYLYRAQCLIVDLFYVVTLVGHRSNGIKPATLRLVNSTSSGESLHGSWYWCTDEHYCVSS